MGLQQQYTIAFLSLAQEFFLAKIFELDVPSGQVAL